MRRGLCAATFALVLAWAAPGLADGGPVTAREAAQAAFARAEQAARELRFQAALDGYDEAFRSDPSAPFAPSARARAADLRAHAEGAFGPLSRLEAVRRDPVKNRDAETIAALDRDARAFPDGRVRAEALLVAAQAYANALDARAKAIAALDVILVDAHADRSTRAMALAEVVALHRAEGDLRAALAAVSREPELLPSLTREVRAAVRREGIAKGCLALLGGLALMALRGGVRALRRLRDVRAITPLVVRPGALAFAFYVGAGGAIFVRLYGGEGDPLPFLGLGIGVALVGMLVRLWALAEVRSSRAGAAVRAACGVLGVLAVAYLVLWRTDGAYLSPLGL